MTSGYSKETTDAFMLRIDEKLDSLKENMVLVKEQVKTTNGRVKSLEMWKAGLVGALGVLTSIVVPLLVWTLSNII